jgi:hypothetical protein
MEDSKLYKAFDEGCRGTLLVVATVALIILPLVVLSPIWLPFAAYRYCYPEEQ